MTRRSLVVLLALAALLPTGCFADGKCVLDEECGTGRYCSNGTCRSLAASGGVDCGAGMAFRAGSCAPCACTADAECALGSRCVNCGCVVAGAPAPDFALLDENPRSATYGQQVGTSSFRGDVLILYFANAT